MQVALLFLHMTMMVSPPVGAPMLGLKCRYTNELCGRGLGILVQASAVRACLSGSVPRAHCVGTLSVGQLHLQWKCKWQKQFGLRFSGHD